MAFGANPFGSLAGAFLPSGGSGTGGAGAKMKSVYDQYKASQAASATAPTGGGWFDQQRPNIPTSAAPAPVYGTGGVPGQQAPMETLTGGMTTGQGIDERAGGQVAPIGMDRTTGQGMNERAPINTGAAPTGAPSSLAGYTGAPININVPFNPQSFVGSDAYNFTKDEGLDALSRYHFANGTAGTGGFSRDVMKFASGNAANYWDKQLAHDTDIATGNANRTLGGLSSLAGNGLSAAGGQAGYGMEAGNAAAGGTIGQANALNTGVSGAANSLAEYFARQRAQPKPPAYGGITLPPNTGGFG